MPKWQSAIKRLIDIALACTGLVILGPLFLVLPILVWCTMGRPIFFAQMRPGLHGRLFKMLKFRSMRNHRDKHGRLLPDGDRLTGIGRFMRSTSLDEIPELINVLKGEMSLVGPRPLLIQYLSRYNEEQIRRHDVKPGITGWAQIHGRNALSWEEKFKLDLWYVDHGSLSVDFKVLMITLWKIVKREGISRAGQATMEEFMGSGTKPDA